MCNIVVVDDEYLEREAIKRIAGAIEGAHVVGEGHCGRLAVELCEALKPDLLFLNCNMGGMNGFEAAKRIRRADSEIAIVMTTAYDKLSAKRDLEALGIGEYLLKPIHPERISEIILKYRKTRRVASGKLSPRKKRRLSFYPNQVMSKEITRALIYIDNHYRDNISLESVSEMVCLSSYYFSRLFKKEVGVNFSDYLQHKRLDCAKQMLVTTDSSVLEISASVGFQEQSYFCKVFKKQCGVTPTDYRKNETKATQERHRLKQKYQ